MCLENPGPESAHKSHAASAPTSLVTLPAWPAAAAHVFPACNAFHQRWSGQQPQAGAPLAGAARRLEAAQPAPSSPYGKPRLLAAASSEQSVAALSFSGESPAPGESRNSQLCGGYLNSIVL